ncbi:hypothetical protein AB0H71_29065 [Nocardia sp. NPDC050697]|uniref:hypothetical protein n=1 Tax=Nocardia sp. NPDC050697 TaxID=3155158 RepID=UPI00340F67B8
MKYWDYLAPILQAIGVALGIIFFAVLGTFIIVNIHGLIHAGEHHASWTSPSSRL